MVWLLTSTGSDCTKHLLDSFPYTVGRLDCSLLLPEDRSVSRRHAYLTQSPLGKTLLLIDADSKFGTFLNTKEIVKNQGVEVRNGDVVRFGVVTSEFKAVFVDLTIFVPFDSISTDVKFSRKADSIEEAMYILLNEGFEATVDIAQLVATGKPVINNKYIDDCIREGQLLDDATYRVIFSRVDLTLQYSPSHTFLSFFGITFGENAGVVIGQNMSNTWISEECLLRACLLGTKVQLNEPMVETIALDSDSDGDVELSDLLEEYNQVGGTTSEAPTGLLSKDSGNRSNGASHALMTYQLVSLCRARQGNNGNTSNNSSKNTKKFVKNVPLVKRRHRGLPTIVGMDVGTKGNGNAFEESTAISNGGAKEAWLVEEKKVVGRKRALATPTEHLGKDRVVETRATRSRSEQQPNAPVIGAVKPTPATENQFKSTFFKSLKK